MHAYGSDTGSTECLFIARGHIDIMSLWLSLHPWSHPKVGGGEQIYIISSGTKYLHVLEDVGR